MRVHSTWKRHRGRARDAEGDERGAARARVDDRRGRQRGGLQLGLDGGDVQALLGAGRRPPRRPGCGGAAITIAAASVRLNAAAVTLVQATPNSGRKTKPEKNAPATAPNRLTA